MSLAQARMRIKGKRPLSSEGLLADPVCPDLGTTDIVAFVVCVDGRMGVDD